MKKTNITLIAAIFMAVSTLLLSNCFSDWRGDEATITLNLGGGASSRAIARNTGPSAEEIDSIIREFFDHKVRLSGPVGVQTFEFGKGQLTAQFTVAPGRYDITVEAYIGVDDYETLELEWEDEDESPAPGPVGGQGEWVAGSEIVYEGGEYFERVGDKYLVFRGSRSVDVIAGKNNPVVIEMQMAILDDWEESGDPGGSYDIGALVFDLIEGGTAYSVRGNKNYWVQQGGTVSIPGDIDGVPVTAIANNAFYDCTGITTVDLDGTGQLATIGEMAFYGCIGLTAVRIPASVLSIGKEAFTGCNRLTIVYFQGNNITFGDSAFPDRLITAYSAAGAGAGTYKKTDNDNWEKLDNDILPGDITISQISVAINDDLTGTQLTANYSGLENVSYQWSQNGKALGDPSWSNQHTTSVSGSYTVTVSAPGYQSKTSDPVTVNE